MLNTTITTLGALSVYLGILYVASTPYKCKPYEPKADCPLSRFEVRVFDITKRDKHVIGVAEGNCVYAVGEGQSRRYVMPEAMFSSAGRTEYFDKGAEFPAIQSLVCEVK
jgi:hypothetical protein